MAARDSRRPSMQTEFRFRLNGDIMPEIYIQRAMVDGEPVGQWEITVDIDYLDGRFTLDDNSHLWDRHCRSSYWSIGMKRRGLSCLSKCAAPCRTRDGTG